MQLVANSWGVHLTKISCFMFIQMVKLFTRMLHGKNLTPWPLTLKVNRVPDSPKDYVCTKFGQNPLKDVDSRVFTRMLHGKNLTCWPWPLTLKINRVTDSLNDVCKYVTSLVKIHWRMNQLGCSQGCYRRTVALLYPFTTLLARG